MNLKPFTPPLLICLACSAAFLLGACSGSNPAGTSSGSDADASDTSRAAARDAVTLADAASLARANDQYAAAQAAVNAATAAVAAAATGSEADRAEARRLIAAARTAIDAAITAAEAALTAAADGSAADIGNAARARDRANALRTSQTRVLDNALASFAWYTKALARTQIPNGEAAMPPSGGDGVTVKIERIPRTIPSPTAPNTQIANEDAFTSTTFSLVPYEDDKLLFSVTDDAEGGDEFKVDGYAATDWVSFLNQQYTYTGLKLTSDGIVVRVGGTPPDSRPAGESSVSTDMRRDITETVDVGAAPHGDNGWDLKLTFGEPHVTPVARGGGSVSDWMGNGAFYWKSIVPADPRQQETGGAYYNSRAFNQPDGFEDLGTYEVWLSNDLGGDQGLEPVPGSGVVRCLDGTTGTSCPGDDTHHYLKYAAYGLFVYTSDRATFVSSTDGQVGRIQTLHFGYSAFDDETGKKTTDIGTAITRGKFRGRTLARAITGISTTPQYRASKLLRGEATLRVSIPKTGNGTIEGDLENFEEWTGSYWRPLTSGFGVDLRSAAISNAGTFSGTAAATGTSVTGRGNNAPDDFPSLYSSGHAYYSEAGGVSSSTGSFKGSFYGPRSDSTDLEVAGGWQFVGVDATQWEIYGSFAAKQRPVE